MNEFINYIKQYINLSDEARKQIFDLALVEEVPKGYILLKEGRICERLYFVVEGTIRTYHYQDGKDITYWIYREDQMLTAWNSFIYQVPATESFEVVEDCALSSFTKEQRNALLSKYPILDHFYRLQLEEQMAAIDEFYKGYFFMTAKEKYDLLISVFPSVTQIANLKHIASMLGISQETLSRIRGVR